MMPAIFSRSLSGLSDFVNFVHVILEPIPIDFLVEATDYHIAFPRIEVSYTPSLKQHAAVANHLIRHEWW
jgi:hypothetical protein